MYKILTLTFVIFFSYLSHSQTYSNGYNQGYKDGYCHRDLGCVAPPPPPGMPGPGKDDYNSGYKDGFSKGVRDKAVNNSSSSYNSSKPAVRQPNQTVYTDYSRMSSDLASKIYQVGQDIQMKRAAAQNYYYQSISFVNGYICNGEIFAFNNLVYEIQNTTKKKIDFIYNQLTSGWLELEDYYTGLNTLVNNYVPVINKCNQINSSIQSRLNQFLNTSDIEGYKSFLADTEIEFKNYKVDYSINWYQKTRRYQNISNQFFMFKYYNKSITETFYEGDFYSKTTSYIRDYVVNKATTEKPVIKIDEKVESKYQSKYLDNCKYPSPMPGEITETVEKCNQLYISGRFSDCIPIYTSLIEKYPEYCIGYYNRGLARYHSGYVNLAKSDFEKALSLGFLEAEEFLKNNYK